ncbi:hypothetical protein TrVE_jg8933 [Triparma verrucosa]|uniref:non-specific serine/threonine protein kinase n=1 Tax=Triparma verrucosa TaxID=1606542 RepID=A0A9W6Z3X1_9STRA|nr:hypothetical protein TrVE_jg8933 [Triparma verrucosa]
MPSSSKTPPNPPSATNAAVVSAYSRKDSMLKRLGLACTSHRTMHLSHKPPQESKCIKLLSPVLPVLNKLEMNVIPSDIPELCLFYSSVLKHTFCPHSMSILSYGEDVDMILEKLNCIFIGFLDDRWDDTTLSGPYTYIRTCKMLYDVTADLKSRRKIMRNLLSLLERSISKMSSQDFVTICPSTSSPPPPPPPPFRGLAPSRTINIKTALDAQNVARGCVLVISAIFQCEPLRSSAEEEFLTLICQLLSTFVVPQGPGPSSFDMYAVLLKTLTHHKPHSLTLKHIPAMVQAVILCDEPRRDDLAAQTGTILRSFHNYDLSVVDCVNLLNLVPKFTLNHDVSPPEPLAKLSINVKQLLRDLLSVIYKSLYKCPGNGGVIRSLITAETWEEIVKLLGSNIKWSLQCGEAAAVACLLFNPDMDFPVVCERLSGDTAEVDPSASNKRRKLDFEGTAGTGVDSAPELRPKNPMKEALKRTRENVGECIRVYTRTRKPIYELSLHLKSTRLQYNEVAGITKMLIYYYTSREEDERVLEELRDCMRCLDYIAQCVAEHCTEEEEDHRFIMLKKQKKLLHAVVHVAFTMTTLFTTSKADVRHPLSPSSKSFKSITASILKVLSEKSFVLKDIISGNNQTSQQVELDDCEKVLERPPGLHRTSSVTSNDTATTAGTGNNNDDNQVPQDTTPALAHPTSSCFCDSTCHRLNRLFGTQNTRTNCYSCKTYKSSTILKHIFLDRNLNVIIKGVLSATFVPGNEVKEWGRLLKREPALINLDSVLGRGGKVAFESKIPSVRMGKIRAIKNELEGGWGNVDGIDPRHILPVPDLPNFFTPLSPDCTAEKFLDTCRQSNLLKKVLPPNQPGKENQQSVTESSPIIRLLLIQTYLASLNAATFKIVFSATLDDRYEGSQVLKFLGGSSLGGMANIPDDRSVTSAASASPNATSTPPPIRSPLLYLFVAMFTDHDHDVRDWLMKHLPDLLCSSSGKVLKCLFSDKKASTSTAMNSESNEWVDSFFKVLDYIIVRNSVMKGDYYSSQLMATGQSQSLTIASASARSPGFASPGHSNPSDNNNNNNNNNNNKILTPITSVLAVLKRLAIKSHSENLPEVFRRCIIRLLRIWLYRDTEYAAHCCLAQLNTLLPLSEVFSPDLHFSTFSSKTNLMTTVIRELLTPTNDDDSTNFFYIHSFLRMWVVRSQNSNSVDIFDEEDEKRKIKRWCDDVMGNVYSNFVLEEDSTSIKRFLQYVNMITATNKQLDLFVREISQMYTPYITASVLLEFEKGPIVFLLREVLNDGMTMQQIIEQVGKSVVRHLLYDYGCEGREKRATQAIRRAASWLEKGGKTSKQRPSSATQASASQSSRPLEHVDQMLNPQKKIDTDAMSEAARLWIKPNVMFLFHGIMHGYKLMEIGGKRHTMRSMVGLISFLHYSDAALYTPKIISSVNIGMGDELCDPEIRYYSIQGLSSFVRILCDPPAFVSGSVASDEVDQAEMDNIDIVGRNLSSIIVAMFPIFSQQQQPPAAVAAEDESFLKKAVTEASQLIQYLVSDRIGTALRPYFSAIPFLPQVPQLSQVRETLRSSGLDLDALSSYDSEDKMEGSEGKFLIILQHRLLTLTNLLVHENVRVRLAVLTHLTQTISENRRLFKKLVESEGSASTRFLTVVEKQDGSQTQNDSTQPFTNTNNDDGGGPATVAGGGVSILIRRLLERCKNEDDAEVKAEIGRCMGEVGVIEPKWINVEEGKVGGEGDADDVAWRLNQPPWKSSVSRYALQLLTNRLVVSLKAANSSQDQDKVGFAMQEILKILNETSKKDVAAPDAPKGGMTKWLSNKLSEKNVLTIVEPYWSTEFRRKDDPRVTKPKPPFYFNGSAYQRWVSKWCRYLIDKSAAQEQSCWKSLFIACSSAVRAEAGVRVAEFLLPLLVLDVLCFGDEEDEKDVVNEIHLVLSSKGGQVSERRRAVLSVFEIVDTLECWRENEVESQLMQKAAGKRTATKAARVDDQWPTEESIERIGRIISLVPLNLRAEASMVIQSHARAVRCLELASREKISDYIFSHTEDNEWDGEHRGIGGALAPIAQEDTGKMQLLLGKLNDVDSMMALGDDGDGDGEEVISVKEVCGDWSSALQGYEQAIILHESVDRMDVEGGEVGEQDHQLEKGLLRSLLNLGQLESVLNQVGGMMNRAETGDKNVAASSLLPSAVEAAWRLQKWPLLSTLLRQYDEDSANANVSDKKQPADLFQVSLGRIMSSLVQNRQAEEVEFPVSDAIVQARNVVMADLATTSGESYTRSLDSLMKLHALREIEQVWESEGLGSQVEESMVNDGGSGWDWTGRLNNLGSTGSSLIINVRLALASVSSVSSKLQGDFWLERGRRARKSGMLNAAVHSLKMAEREYKKMAEKDMFKVKANSVQLQLAKVKRAMGLTSSAFQMIDEKGSFSAMVKMKNEKKVKQLEQYIAEEGGHEWVGRKLICSNEWLVESNLKQGREVMDRYKLAVEITDDWEKSHFYFARYCDGLYEKRLDAKAVKRGEEETGQHQGEKERRTAVLKEDKTCHNYLLQAVEQYFCSLHLGDKHMYQAMPRLLTLWFEFCEIDVEMAEKDKPMGSKRANKAAGYGSRDRTVDLTKDASSSSSRKSSKGTSYASDEDYELFESQRALHDLIQRQLSNGGKTRFPEHIIYTALPQLIALSASHTNTDTKTLIQYMLRKVLAKYPLQAMWSLAWLRQSNDRTRKQIAETVFEQAIKDLKKAGNKDHQKILEETPSLFAHLKRLADYAPGQNQRAFTFETWKPRNGVALSDFVPPVQAALSVNVARAMGEEDKERRRKGVCGEIFPLYVPRIESFSKKIIVMNSKAKPKKLTAYAVAASGKEAKKKKQPKCGEMHFLVKREDKGDLRKDARVQDLNNVINRVLAGMVGGSDDVGGSVGVGGGAARRLRLRTFTVTCLSEDCGILEWVPSTSSLREVVRGTHNSQCHPNSNRRSGTRLGDFASDKLRGAFVRYQDQYVKGGDLNSAAHQFEKALLAHFPPLLYWYFIQKYPDPHAWFEARRRFTLSAAVWSAVGHILGLGDRHAENILIDTSCGEVVHVDFDCLFDKGTLLSRPEVVPFRLTQNMVDAMGATGYRGAFTGGLVETLAALRGQRELLLAVLAPFAFDPCIEWSRGDKNSGSKNRATRDAEAGRKAISVLDGRLRGVYNLKNPNKNKIKRTDGGDQETDGTDALLPLGVEGQAEKLIAEATNPANLVQMYVGWMPWL